MFDFDGVIVDSLDEQCRAYTATMRARGLPHLASREQFLAFTEDNWFAALADAGVPEQTVTAIEDAIAATPSPRPLRRHRAGARGAGADERRHHHQLEPHERHLAGPA